MKVSGMLVDVHERAIYPATVSVEEGRIKSIERTRESYDSFILPGLIDAHVHIESSMVTPGAFAMTAVKHGTTGVVSDPHEIANVMGLEGVNFMIDDSKKVPLNFWFGAPSCVPATSFESSGAIIDSKAIERLLSGKNIKFLSEMMNYPGVILQDEEVFKKISAAQMFGKPIDGHAPGLSGADLMKYISAGISTDHECGSYAEAREKIALGMKVIIREGSAARNLDSLKELLLTDPEMVMLCSDDIHPEMLVSGHINRLVSKLVKEGYDLFDVLRACTVNPVSHYSLEAGLLQPGQPADFIIVGKIEKMDVLETWINGEKVFDRGAVLFDYKKGESVNNFNCRPINSRDIQVVRKGDQMMVIGASDGGLLTKKIVSESGKGKLVEADTSKDILKIVVKDRYKNGQAVTGFIKGFGLKHGAFASSVAHDSHNIVCVGANDSEIVSAINEVIRLKGGLSVSSSGKVSSMKLNIAGIMSDLSCENVALDYERLSAKVKEIGCSLSAPFMTLSFMALLVIPELKIGDKGLFDVEQFRLIPLFIE